MTGPEVTDRQWISLLVLIGGTALILAYDLAVAYLAPRLTISMAVRPGFRACPTALLGVVFWMGVLAGHWLFPSD